MAVKDISALTAGLNAGSDFFTKLRSIRSGIDAEGRADTGVDLAKQREALAQQAQVQTAHYQDGELEIQRRHVELLDQQQRIKALEDAQKTGYAKAEKDAALYRVQHSGGRSSPEDFSAGAAPLFKTMPFGLGSAMSQGAAGAMLDSMTPEQVSAVLVSGQRKRAHEIISRLDPEGARAFAKDIESEAQSDVKAALSHKVGDMIRRADVAGLFSTGGGEQGADGKQKPDSGQRDTGIVDSLTQLAVTDPAEALRQYNSLISSSKKERAWLNYTTTTVQGAEIKVLEASESPYISGDRKKELHSALEDMRHSVGIESEFDKSYSRLNSMLTGDSGVPKVRFSTGHGDVTLEDRTGALTPGRTIDRTGEGLLRGVAQSIVSGAPHGTVDTSTPGSTALELMRARSQAAEQIGVKRHPALVLDEATSVFDKMMSDDIPGVRKIPADQWRTIDDDTRAKVAKKLPEGSPEFGVALDLIRTADMSVDGAVAKAQQVSAQRRPKAVEAINEALRDAGINDTIDSPEGQLIGYLASTKTDLNQIDVFRASDGFDVAVEALTKNPDMSVPDAIKYARKVMLSEQAVGDEARARIDTGYGTWKKKYAPNDSGADYDLRGAFAAGVKPDAENGHFPDTFKKPNHPTFSIESQYWKPGMAAGRWEGDKFIKMNAKEADAWVQEHGRQ